MTTTLSPAPGSNPDAAPDASPHNAALPPRRRGWWGMALGGLILAATAAVLVEPRLVDEIRKRVEPAAAPAKPAPPRVVPVGTVPARRADVGVTLDSLGSVVPTASVTIRSRVDGELVTVAFTEGQDVAEGDLLAEIDQRPFQVRLRQAEGQLARDEAALEAARLDLERYESLRELRQVTGQQIDAQKALVRQCEAALEIDRAQIDDVRLQLDYCRITAPISGRIGLRLVDPGNIVRANDPAGLAVVAQLRPITVVFTVPQDDVIRVQRALAASAALPVEAYNRDFRARLGTGTLLAVDNQVDTATGTVRLKAVFPNDDGTLFPSQFVNARLLVETVRDAVVVPAAAVQRGPDSSFVYVVQPDATVALRKVRTGAVQGDEVAVVDGLAADEQVVTDGIDRLTDKAKVSVKGNAGGSGPRDPGSAPAAVAGKPQPAPGP